MEKNNAYTYDTKELEAKIMETLGKIKAMIELNEYVVNNEEDFKALFGYKSSGLFRRSSYASLLGNSSKRMLKKTNKMLRLFDRKPTRETANRFIHFLRTRVLAKKVVKKYSEYSSYTYTTWESPYNSIKILPSLKEQEIQNKRKAWLKLRDEADQALKAYKEEKGDFYKKRLVKQAA